MTRIVFAVMFAAMAFVLPVTGGDRLTAQDDADLEQRLSDLEEGVWFLVENGYLLPPVLEIPTDSPLFRSMVIYQAELNAPQYVLYLDCTTSGQQMQSIDVTRLACVRTVYNPNAPMPAFLPD